MVEILNAMYAFILMLNLFALSSGRILTVIRVVAVQGVILGILPLLIHTHLTIIAVFTSLVTVLLKGVLIPSIMIKALRDIKIKREIEPLIGLLPSTIIGAIITAVVFLVFSHLSSGQDSNVSIIIPTSIITVLIGFILLTTRYKALIQVLGYLVLENGIYIFSLLLVESIPVVVEMGMLLDLFVSIFIISIITNHINQAFSSLDTRNLVSLKE